MAPVSDLALVAEHLLEQDLCLSGGSGARDAYDDGLPMALAVLGLDEPVGVTQLRGVLHELDEFVLGQVDGVCGRDVEPVAG